MKSSRHYFKFQEWLVPKVREASKRCTIRAKRARLPKVGDLAVLERWTGRPYCSEVERLGIFPLVDVRPVLVEAWDGRREGIRILFDGVELIGNEARQLAMNDGFDNLQAFADFFRPRLPFAGHYYEWNPDQPQTP